ncbi:hypothetical protein SELMODRAFT_417132 [Selaginella moellendorffii]|uniref:Uncharacterized protein n=1 Tax=Selaginella moellendorffii TaxID=88036 RepID=D8S1G8_SELML|nr:hypothetical protein SELMODRAFT_417132 [Selaginella moellendorffii]
MDWAARAKYYSNIAWLQPCCGRVNKVGASINPSVGADSGEAVIEEGPSLGVASRDTMIGEGSVLAVDDQVVVFYGVNPRLGVEDSAAARIGERNLENTEANPQCFSTDKASWEAVVRCVLCKGPVKGIGPTGIRRHFCSFYKEKEDIGCCTPDISLCRRPIQEFSEEFVSITRNNIETYNIKLVEFE